MPNYGKIKLDTSEIKVGVLIRSEMLSFESEGEEVKELTLQLT